MVVDVRSRPAPVAHEMFADTGEPPSVPLLTVEIINESGTGVNQLLTGAEFDGMLTIHRRIGQTNGLPK